MWSQSLVWPYMCSSPIGTEGLHWTGHPSHTHTHAFQFHPQFVLCSMLTTWANPLILSLPTANQCWLEHSLPLYALSRCPHPEDLCIFDTKFLLSSTLLSCWLFLTCWPSAQTFPYLNRDLSFPTLWLFCLVAQCTPPFAAMCCLLCSWTSAHRPGPAALPCPHPVLWTFASSSQRTPLSLLQAPLLAAQLAN